MVDLDAVRLGSETEKLAYVPLMHDEIKRLREKVEEIEATLEDEEAAHQDTLRLWNESKAEVTRLREALAFVRKYADETHDYWDAGVDSTVGKRLLALAGELKGYDAGLDEAFSQLGDS